jgi:YbbR domain-containing protein
MIKSVVTRPILYLWEFVRYQFALKVLSVVIAATLWVVVFGSRTIEITKEIPFEVQMTDDQILVDPVPEKIQFRLVGPKAFIRNITTRIEDPIRANVKDLKTGVFTHRIYSDSIKLPMGVKVQAINPNVIQIKVEELKKRMVSVKLESTGEAPSGFKVLRTEVLPPQIRIKGPKNRISGLSVLPSLPVDFSGIRETQIIPLAFDFKALGIEPDSTVPELNVEIQGKGQAFRVKHVPVRIRSTLKAKSDDEEVTVIVRTDPADNVKIDGEQVKAEIDMRDMPSGEFIRWIKIGLPEKVHLVRVIPPLTRVVVKAP